MTGFWTLLWRGLQLRCPICGKGKLFRRGLVMHEKCPICGFKFEREEGYFTGAMAINLVISEFLVAALVIPFGVFAGLHPDFPYLPYFLLGLPLPVVLPLLFFRHSRSLWMSVDHWLNPPHHRYTP